MSEQSESARMNGTCELPCSPRIQPVGVHGAEYRRQWNRLNREVMRVVSHNYSKRHGISIPKWVVEKYRSEKRHLDKHRYYAGWENAKRRNEPWDCIDDELVMAQDVTDRELGKMIGRSIKAIQTRRHRLRKENTRIADTGGAKPEGRT